MYKINYLPGWELTITWYFIQIIARFYFLYSQWVGAWSEWRNDRFD